MHAKQVLDLFPASGGRRTGSRQDIFEEQAVDPMPREAIFSSTAGSVVRGHQVSGEHHATLDTECTIFAQARAACGLSLFPH